MKAKEIHDLSKDALSGKLADLSEELFRLKFQHGIRPLENPAKLKAIRKDIARIKTIIGEKTGE